MKAEDRYAGAVARNVSNALRRARDPKAGNRYEGQSLHSSKIKLGIRKGDTQWDLDVENIISIGGNSRAQK